MSNYICPYVCSYKSPSGFCGYTGGYESCQYKRITGYDDGAKRFCAEPLEAPETINIPKPSPNIPSMVPYYPCQAETCAENADNDQKNALPEHACPWCTDGLKFTVIDDAFGHAVKPNMIHYCFACGRPIPELIEDPKEAET